MCGRLVVVKLTGAGTRKACDGLVSGYAVSCETRTQYSYGMSISSTVLNSRGSHAQDNALQTAVTTWPNPLRRIRVEARRRADISGADNSDFHGISFQERGRAPASGAGAWTLVLSLAQCRECQLLERNHSPRRWNKTGSCGFGCQTAKPSCFRRLLSKAGSGTADRDRA